MVAADSEACRQGDSQVSRMRRRQPTDHTRRWAVSEVALLEINLAGQGGLPQVKWQGQVIAPSARSRTTRRWVMNVAWNPG